VTNVLLALILLAAIFGVSWPLPTLARQIAAVIFAIVAVVVLLGYFTGTPWPPLNR
jgi:hypothetical protein